MKFIIKDWADNICFKGKEFDDFEDAWGFIYEKYKHLSEEEFNEQMQEYFVEEKPKTKAFMVNAIIESEAKEFGLCEEERYFREEELRFLSREHLEDIYKCRFMAGAQ